jgi:hypothetical protein
MCANSQRRPGTRTIVHRNRTAGRRRRQTHGSGNRSRRRGWDASRQSSFVVPGNRHRRWADLEYRQTDQPARAQCDHRARPRRRSGGAALPSSPTKCRYPSRRRKRPTKSHAGSRNRLIFDSRAGLCAARNTRPYLVQSNPRPMGGDVIVMLKEVAAPIRVAGSTGADCAWPMNFEAVRRLLDTPTPGSLHPGVPGPGA